MKLTVFVFIPIQKKTTVNMKMKNLSRNFIRKKKKAKIYFFLIPNLKPKKKVKIYKIRIHKMSKCFLFFHLLYYIIFQEEEKKKNRQNKKKILN